MHAEIRNAPFDPWEVLRSHEAAQDSCGKFGAIATFVGTMRDFNDGRAVSGMLLEHYPGMTEQPLRAIGEEAGKRWPLLDWLVVHRVGDIRPAEAIVLVATWAAHRGDALDACRFIIDDLKSRAPFWKKELTDTGAHWVAGNTSGYKGAGKA